MPLDCEALHESRGNGGLLPVRREGVLRLGAASLHMARRGQGLPRGARLVRAAVGDQGLEDWLAGGTSIRSLTVAGVKP